ncbi:MAG: aminopeptidase P family protein [Elusimicrobia bacterium]|nr:aminopeptidase P family protein [Elusimicrobiota bacterium]
MNLRLKKLREKIELKNLDGLVSFNPSNIFYLTGFYAENAFIFVSPGEAMLVVPKLIYPSVKELAKHPPWQVKVINDYIDFFKKYKYKKIGLEDSIPYKYLKKLDQVVKVKNYGNLIEDMRITKDKDEISKIRTACKISKKAIRFAEDKIKTGLTEKSLADDLEHFLRKNGAEKSSFDIIVASGKNSAKPHHSPTNRKFQKNDIIVVDLGCIYKGYNSDLTRTFFLGKINNYVKKVLNTVSDAYIKAIGMIKDGVACMRVDFTARSIINKNGFKKHFIHSTGHGIGIDIHEEPMLSAGSDKILKKGMVVSVEPGIYIPDRFGVRIEDTVLVTENGCKVMT